ncbi:efflux transporter outer membrane subunit [Caulobacter segnis]|uniref:efflux transporter outer membrane subunit n=1 Tax=Caulobacter segnis TaxID=88688 RepID=UPI0028609303|nr:efflux transporter outer membrane subunit [Caulobacter segnis]MDR6624400.1 NodT family efflux transporter outer membrane factor (OMF) lipoprotein [Caulobacter segnis]
MKTRVLLCCLALAGCAVGPDYQAPSVPSAAGTGAAGLAMALDPQAVRNEPAPDRWWSLYHDPVLERLVADALAHNPDLRTAAANLTRARAALSERRADRLPSTQTSVAATRERLAAGQGRAGPEEISLYRAGFDVAYEADLFGGVSRAIEAARADADAAKAELDAARVSIAAETANAYAAACGAGFRAKVAAETVALQTRTLDLMRTLDTAGRSGRRDVDRADVLLAQSQAVVPTIEAERRSALFALATLTGRPPQDIDGEAQACIEPLFLDAPLPVGDSAGLLARRPDVRAAERRLHAQTARIGVATAALYPSVVFGGSVSSSGRGSGELLKSPGLAFSVGPLVSWNFPNQAAARAQVRQASAGADAALAQFDGVVLNALRETEDALSRYVALRERAGLLRRAEESSTRAAELSRMRFSSGADGALPLLEAERDRVQARAALAQVVQDLSEAEIGVFKSLGGGWREAPEPRRLAAQAAGAEH